MMATLDQRTPASPRVALAAWGGVVLASILMLATLPGRTQGLGLVTEPILAELRIDRLAYANLNLWATLIGALFCFPTGWALDRWGLRPVTATCLVLLGGAVWMLSRVGDGVVPLFLLLVATRATGQSALSVCSITTVGKWFPVRAGPAMGAFSVLLSIFFAIAFGVVGWSVRAHGWRLAWQGIALALMAAILPLVLLALREPPRGPDIPVPEGSVSAAERRPAGTSLSEALRTPLFWVFAGAGALFNLASAGLGLFNEAVLAESGFDQQAYHRFLVISTLFALVGQLGCGWLTRRHRFQTLALWAMVLYAVALGIIPMVRGPVQLTVVAALLGVAGGMIIVLFFAVWGEAFGGRQLGRIQGAAQMLTVISSALGPVLFAECHARAGSYAPLLYGLVPVLILMGIAAERMRFPSAAVVAA
jgi:MFS family permease